MPKRKRSNRNRLDVATTAEILPRTVPKRWVKFLVGFFLLFPAWVLTQTFFTAFARATVNDTFWLTEEFWFFSLGIVLWMVIFFTLPRPLWIYVFGHELSHAVCVWLMGGRVHHFEVNSHGGHILADRTNTWIALAPYVLPIYSVFAIIIYGLLGLVFGDISAYRTILYAAVGFTWAFHMSFTCWMIMKGQPDLYYGGTFFSLTVIYLLNLMLLAALLILASPQVTWMSFGRDLFQNAIELTSQLTTLGDQMMRLVIPMVRGLHF